MIFISVIIPLYNKENYIAKTIQSILNQNYQNFEIIIVDDCSTDASLQKIKPFLSERVKIVQHTVNKGVSASRNTGIKNSKANYITFLDADDVWNFGYLNKIIELIENFPEAKIFATNYFEVYPNKLKILPQTTLESNENANFLINDFFKSSLGQPFYCSCSVCFEKSVFETVGLYNEKITFGEDTDFNIRANLKFKMAFCKESFVDYIIFSENQSTNSSINLQKITDFDFYEKEFPNHKSLIKYLDFNRYILAKMYKSAGNLEKYKKLKQKINLKNLTFKQRMLLAISADFIIFIKKIKFFFLKKGIRFTSYR